VSGLVELTFSDYSSTYFALFVSFALVVFVVFAGDVFGLVFISFGRSFISFLFVCWPT